MFKDLHTFLKVLEVFVGIFFGVAVFGSIFIFFLFSTLGIITSFIFALFSFCFFTFMSLLTQSLIFLLKK